MAWRWSKRPTRAAPSDAAAAKAAVEQRHGPWTAHNVELAPGVWTMKDGVVNFDEKTRRALQVTHDFFGEQLGGLRVLDLGAGEGGLSLELARHGASVVCVEGRESNLAKARLAAELLGLSDMEFIAGDVRQLTGMQGPFDLVLCFGLLYHLEAAAAADLLREMARLCRRLAVIDTHFSLEPAEQVDVGGARLSGRTFREFPDGVDAAAMLASKWSSIGNLESFWLTRASLLNLLTRAGFATVYEIAAPLVFDYFDRGTDERYKYPDRATFVAAKSPRARVLTSPRVNELPVREWPEDLGAQLVPSPIDR